MRSTSKKSFEIGKMVVPILGKSQGLFLLFITSAMRVFSLTLAVLVLSCALVHAQATQQEALTDNQKQDSPLLLLKAIIVGFTSFVCCLLAFFFLFVYFCCFDR
jgi:succinate dehydrogenase hydrophobic anchor subunit